MSDDPRRPVRSADKDSAGVGGAQGTATTKHAEKIVKAKILELGGDFDYVHDIVVLLADFIKTPQITQARKYAQILNRYAVRARYPADVPFEADEIMVEEAYKMAASFPELLDGARLKTNPIISENRVKKGLLDRLRRRRTHIHHILFFLFD